MLFSELVKINPKISLERGNEYPCVMMDEVEPGRKFVSGIISKQLKGGSKFQKGDTLFARITPCLENGKIAKYTGQNGNYGFGSTEFFVFRAKDDVSDSDYVYYLALSDIIRKPAEASMFGASGRQRADLSVVENIEIDPPTLPIQRKIAGILSAYDALIENNTRRIKILEEMSQTIFREWFVNFHFPGHEKVKLIESELGMIPEGWEVGRFGDVCQVIPGYAFKSKDWQEEGIPVIKIKNITSNNTVDIEKIDYVPEKNLNPKLEKYILKTGDFLIAMTGATAGKIGKLRANSQMLLNQRVAKIKPDVAHNNYMWCIISDKEKQRQFFRLADGAAQPNMSGSQIENITLLMPPLTLCKRFSEIVEPLLVQVDNFYFRNANLRRTRDLLLPKLISGELDVSELYIEIKG